MYNKSSDSGQLNRFSFPKSSYSGNSLKKYGTTHGWHDQWKKLIILLAIGILFNACATILGGKSNTLVFSEKSSPKAEVYIDGERMAEAPGKIKVPKEKIQHGSRLVLKADGYEEKEYLLLRKQSGVYSVVDLLTGVVPLVVDYATGNIYRPQPRKFEYELVKEITPKRFEE